LILRDGKIKVIIEIEESNVKPTQVCGKFLTSALSNCGLIKEYNHLEMDNSVLFLQILDTSKLVKGKTSKVKQWRQLENAINNILPLKGSRIIAYKILTTDELPTLQSAIKDILG
jgi:hypothetical protein